MLDSLIRKFFFAFEPETAQRIGLSALDFLEKAGIACLFASAPEKMPVEAMGLSFPNPVGLAAGLDKDGKYIDALAALGFGFIEVGTVTPRPQLGNIKPRLYRVPDDEAIISRMGLNNAGIDPLIDNIARARFRRLGGILGVNIGKNNVTAPEDAAEDYLVCLEHVYPLASYVALNVSWLNPHRFSEAEQEEALNRLLASVKDRQSWLADKHGKYVPLVLKVSPDLMDTQISSTVALLRKHKIDGVIASNATFFREGVTLSVHNEENGALSGNPLFERSTAVLKKFADELAGEIPLIGTGGIMTGENAAAKIEAGASLVQLYAGLVFHGPKLVGEVGKAIRAVGSKG